MKKTATKESDDSKLAWRTFDTLGALETFVNSMGRPNLVSVETLISNLGDQYYRVWFWEK